MMVEDDCVFCKNDFRKAVFSESKSFLAAYNIAPILPGHSLVLPKNHLQSLLDLPDTEYQEMMSFCVSTVKFLLEVFDADGFDLSIQDGESAGQTIPHLHVHLIPRTTNDLNHPGDWYPKVLDSNHALIDSKNRERLSDPELDQVVNYLRKNKNLHD